MPDSEARDAAAPNVPLAQGVQGVSLGIVGPAAPGADLASTSSAHALPMPTPGHLPESRAVGGMPGLVSKGLRSIGARS